MLRQTLKIAAVVLYVVAVVARGARGESELATAQALLLKGRYEEAAERFSRLSETSPTAAIGVARCKQETGKREEALAVLNAAAERFSKSAAVPAVLALAAIDRGELDEARRQVDAALALDKDCVAARWADAELLRLAGRLDEAERAYGWFIRYYNRSPRIDDPGALVLIARGVAQHARWTRNSNHFRRLVNEVLPVVLERDPNY